MTVLTHMLNPFLLLIMSLVNYGAYVFRDDAGPPFTTGKIQLPILIIAALLAIPGVITGLGLMRGKGWARPMAKLINGIGIVVLPIGTALALYTFWALSKRRASDPTPSHA